jgi:hypothetical protein
MSRLATYPCPCGSKKQYRKCCLFKKNTLPPQLVEHFEKIKQEQTKLHSMGIYVNYVKPVIFQGGKVWALGNKIYHGRRPEETFHEFILDVFKQTLGKEWWDEQLASQKKHFIMLCFLHYFEWQKKNATEANKANENSWYAIPDGWTQSLISLAFDVCSLQHAASLPEKLLSRLKNKNEYQGARYEIAVAAIFARLDCEIDFLDA